MTPRHDRAAASAVQPERTPRTVPALHDANRDARGQASVELALVLPLVALLLLGLLQAGVLLRDQLLVVQAAREGAREASVTPRTERIVAAVRRAAPGLGGDLPDRPVTRRGAGLPDSAVSRRGAGLPDRPASRTSAGTGAGNRPVSSTGGGGGDRAVAPDGQLDIRVQRGPRAGDLTTVTVSVRPTRLPVVGRALGEHRLEGSATMRVERAGP